MLLACDSTEAAASEATDHLSRDHYPGCNLLIAGTDKAIVVEYGDELQITELPPGFHLVTNGALNDRQDLRIARIREVFASDAPDSPDEWLARARVACGLRAAPNHPAICLEGADRGTVSSTIVALAEQVDKARYLYASGPPSVTPFADYSPRFREILGAAPRAAGRHRIHLRGPWRFEPGAIDGASDAGCATGHAPTAGTAHLPASWNDLFGEYAGPIVFRRLFHRPPRLEPHERVYIVLEGVEGRASVTVNGMLLGSVDRLSRSFSRDVTPLLNGNDELRIEVERQASSPELQTAPPWTIAAVEIRSD